MPRDLAHCGLAALIALIAMAAMPTSPTAQDAKPAAASTPESEDERKERETRKACAVALCSTLHNHKPATGEVTCNVQKTWRKEVLTKIMERGKLTWPWGKARCTGNLKVDRATLIKGTQKNDIDCWACPNHDGVGITVSEAWGHLQDDEVKAIWKAAKRVVSATAHGSVVLSRSGAASHARPMRNSLSLKRSVGGLPVTHRSSTPNRKGDRIRP